MNNQELWNEMALYEEQDNEAQEELINELISLLEKAKEKTCWTGGCGCWLQGSDEELIERKAKLYEMIGE